MTNTIFKIQDGQKNLSDAETVMILAVTGILNESNCDVLTEPKRILNLLHPLENHGIFQSIKVEAVDMRPMYDMSLHLKWRTADMAEGEWRCVKFMLQKRENTAIECIKQIKSAIPTSIIFERHGDGRLHIDGVSLFDAMRRIYQIIDDYEKGVN